MTGKRDRVIHKTYMSQRYFVIIVILFDGVNEIRCPQYESKIICRQRKLTDDHNHRYSPYQNRLNIPRFNGNTKREFFCI